MLVWALSRGVALFAAFGGLGVLLAAGQLRFWLRPPESKRAWWFQHMGGMFGSCIATVTAFVVVNAGWFGAGRFNLVVWLAPTVVGVGALQIWQAHYRKKFAATS
jgi:hypothetical protein